MFLHTNLKRVVTLFFIQALFTVSAFAQTRVIWAICGCQGPKGPS